jgi:hypothetical protein
MADELRRGDWVRPMRNIKLDKKGTMLLADETYLVGEIGTLYGAIDKFTDAASGGPNVARLLLLKVIAEMSGLPDIELVMLVVDTAAGAQLLAVQRKDLMKVDHHG